jgi:3',5'-cyclic AMP phosphodiesterase CpdA
VRILLHLSDLHFGRIDEAILPPLVEFAHRLAPDVVVVSGDLTQRARSEQFRQARVFLDRLPAPQVVVPGNHDVPLYNLAARFLHPLAKFRRHISPDLEPAYVDAEVAVLGVNSARSLTFQGGRVNQKQIEHLRARLCALDDHVTKVVVSHHPFDLPETHGRHDLIGRAPLAMRMFASCGADLLLAGHVHLSSSGSTAARYRLGAYSALVVQAGTATSTRSRGEANSFNVIRIQSNRIAIERMVWQPQARLFQAAPPERFQRLGNEWSRLA